MAEAFYGDLGAEMLKALHIDDRVEPDRAGRTANAARLGWARFVCTQPTFPTRLKAPFATIVRAETVRWQLEGLMADDGVAAHLLDHLETTRILAQSVSKEAGAILHEIGVGRPARLDSGTFLNEVLRNSRRIDAGTASWLGQILSPERVERLERVEMYSILEELRQAEFQMSDGNWGKAALMPRDREGASQEERMIAAFAPGREILAEGYASTALHLYQLAQSGGRLGSLMTPRNLADLSASKTRSQEPRQPSIALSSASKGV